jgi:hypothetical protein
MTFNVEESAALLREVYPRYPDLRGSHRPPADIEQWLEEYRKKMACIEASESSRSS